MIGDNCASSCATHSHRTFGECVRAQNQKVAYCGIGGLDRDKQRQWDSDLAAYKSARLQGVQPASTQREAVDRAMKLSESTGQAWQA